jgi:hypothetical protein
MTRIRYVALTAAAVGHASLIVPALAGGLADRERMLAAFDQLPVPRLEVVFMECDRASSHRLMALDEGAYCAMAWDALLRRKFGGDVAALLTWWRAKRALPAPSAN